jgi:hypothetical protein
MSFFGVNDSLVSVEWEAAAVPPGAPMAGWEVDGRVGLLTLPRLGSARISESGIVLLSPDETTAQALWARIGDWVAAQTLQARGLTVLRGAAIGREGQVVVLSGPPRCGASISALIACQQGWGLVADGHVVLDPSGRILNASTEVVVDTDSISLLPPQFARRALPTRRPRSAVTVDTHPGGVVNDLVLMSMMQGMATISVTEPAPDALLGEILVNAAFDRSLPATTPDPMAVVLGIPGIRLTRLVRPFSLRPEHGPECRPPGIVQALITRVTSLPAAP